MNDDKLYRKIGAIEAHIGNIIDGQKVRDEASEKRDDIMAEVSLSLASTATILERLEPLVDNHEKIASSINSNYLDRLDAHHAFIAKQIKQKEFWEGARNRLKEKGLLVLLICVSAAMLWMFGFNDEAKKILGL